MLLTGEQKKVPLCRVSKTFSCNCQQHLNEISLEISSYYDNKSHKINAVFTEMGNII